MSNERDGNAFSCLHQPLSGLMEQWCTKHSPGKCTFTLDSEAKLDQSHLNSLNTDKITFLFFLLTSNIFNGFSFMPVSLVEGATV